MWRWDVNRRAKQDDCSGMAAMLGFSKDADLEEKQEAMTDELDTVISGQVTHCRSRYDDWEELKTIMGIVDGNIVRDKTRIEKEAAIQMAKAMLDEDSEVVTIIYGEDGNKEEAEAIEQQ